MAAFSGDTCPVCDTDSVDFFGRCQNYPICPASQPGFCEEDDDSLDPEWDCLNEEEES